MIRPMCQGRQKGSTAKCNYAKNNKIYSPQRRRERRGIIFSFAAERAANENPLSLRCVICFPHLILKGFNYGCFYRDATTPQRPGLP